MDWPKKILIWTLGVNVALGITFAVLPPPSPGLSVASVTPPAQALKADKPAEPASDTSATPKTKGGIVDNTAKFNFSWPRLESADYKQYIANLRSIGCPEATIQDIIIAEMDYLYEPKLNALKGLSVPLPKQRFWAENAPSARSPQRTAEADMEIKRLEQERRDLVKELLGVEERSLRRINNYFEEAKQGRYAYLTADKASQLRTLEKEYEKEGGALQSGTGYQNEAARQKMLAQMGAFMTPGEIFEYEIRTSNLAKQLRESLKAAAPNEAEFRTIFTANYELKNLGTDGEKPTPEQLEAAKKKAADAALNALGEDRYSELSLSKDPGYRQLMAASSYLGYDKAAVLRVQNTRADSEKAAQAILTNTSLTPEQRQQALLDIRTAAEKNIKTALGPTAAKYYLKGSGYWLNNLGGRTRTN